MLIKKSWILIMALCVPSFVVAAVSTDLPTSYSLKEMYTMAAAQHEDLLKHENTLQAIRADYTKARGAVLPYVGIVGSEIFQDTTGVSQGSGASSTFTSSRKQEYKISAKQSVYSGNRDQDILKALKSQLNQETLSLKQLQLSLYRSVTDAYFDVLYLQKDLIAIQESMDIVSSRIKELSYRVKIGKSRQSEVLSAEAQLASLASQKEAFLGQLKQAKIALTNIVGSPLSDLKFNEPSDNFSTKIRLQPLSNTFSTFSSIQSLEEQKRGYEYYKLSELHATRPKVTAGANYYLDRTEYLSPINWDVSLSLEIPLYQGGVPKASGDYYDTHIRSVELEIRKTRRAIQSALDSDYAERDALLKEKTALELAHKKSKESYAVYVEEYRLGLVNNLEVLQAASQQLDIKRQLDKALLRLKRNAIQVAIDSEELP